jgi:hypothetical protein
MITLLKTLGNIYNGHTHTCIEGIKDDKYNQEGVFIPLGEEIDKSWIMGYIYLVDLQDRQIKQFNKDTLPDYTAISHSWGRSKWRLGTPNEYGLCFSAEIVLQYSVACLEWASSCVLEQFYLISRQDIYGLMCYVYLNISDGKYHRVLIQIV